MRKRWFYFGGLAPESWSSTLKVEDDRLFGVRNDQCYEVLPTNIVEVKEYNFNNPFLRITTTDGDFHVGAMTMHYDDVVRILRRQIGDRFCDTFSHRWNAIFYRKQFSLMSLVKSLFSIERNRGRKPDG